MSSNFVRLRPPLINYFTYYIYVYADYKLLSYTMNVKMDIHLSLTSTGNSQLTMEPPAHEPFPCQSCKFFHSHSKKSFDRVCSLTRLNLSASCGDKCFN